MSRLFEGQWRDLSSLCIAAVAEQTTVDAIEIGQFGLLPRNDLLQRKTDPVLLFYSLQ